MSIAGAKYTYCAVVTVVIMLAAQVISAPQDRPAAGNHLSPCARAIIGCCRGKVMNVECSESLNCGASFFDHNPCEERFVQDALKAAKKFYSQLNAVKT